MGRMFPVDKYGNRITKRQGLTEKPDSASAMGWWGNTKAWRAQWWRDEHARQRLSRQRPPYGPPLTQPMRLERLTVTLGSRLMRPLFPLVLPLVLTLPPLHHAPASAALLRFAVN